MNVNDTKSSLEYSAEFALIDIFNYQHQLALKYLPIEKSNGLLQSDAIPGSIHDRFVQARIKDMTWRSMEEVAEALEAYEAGDDVHFYEELADALHFLVEKMLIVGFEPKHTLEHYFNSLHTSGQSRGRQLNSAVVGYLTAAGLSCNCLKNKPWKTSHMLTDTTKFMANIEHEWLSFIMLCKVAGFTPESLFNMYMRKNAVNQFRQNSGY